MAQTVRAVEESPPQGEKQSNKTHSVSPTCTQGDDSKREEFRKYLEKEGVLDALTKGWAAVMGGPVCSGVVKGSNVNPCSVFVLVLVGLYEEPDKPKDALEYPSTHCVLHPTPPPLCAVVSLVLHPALCGSTCTVAQEVWTWRR